MKFIHEGVKYSCEYCDYKATEKGSLQKHLKSFHDESNIVVNIVTMMESNIVVNIVTIKQLQKAALKTCEI